jgi:hypothetical protein
MKPGVPGATVRASVVATRSSMCGAEETSVRTVRRVKRMERRGKVGFIFRKC